MLPIFLSFVAIRIFFHILSQNPPACQNWVGWGGGWGQFWNCLFLQSIPRAVWKLPSAVAVAMRNIFRTLESVSDQGRPGSLKRSFWNLWWWTLVWFWQNIYVSDDSFTFNCRVRLLIILSFQNSSSIICGSSAFVGSESVVTNCMCWLIAPCP